MGIAESISTRAQDERWGGDRGGRRGSEFGECLLDHYRKDRHFIGSELRNGRFKVSSFVHASEVSSVGLVWEGRDKGPCPLTCRQWQGADEGQSSVWRANSTSLGIAKP